MRGLITIAIILILLLFIRYLPKVCLLIKYRIVLIKGRKVEESDFCEEDIYGKTTLP